MIDKTTLKLAAELAQAYERQHCEYLGMCEDYARRGLRAPSCEHGANLWVAWDNICGYCENGETFADPMFRRRAALTEARRRMRIFGDLLSWLTEASRLGVENTVNRQAINRRLEALTKVN